jgi:hypothetical protein
VLLSDTCNLEPTTTKSTLFTSTLISPTRAILEDVESSFDYAIIAKSAQKDIAKLQKEKLELEARRTGTLRRIRNLDGVLIQSGSWARWCQIELNMNCR